MPSTMHQGMRRRHVDQVADALHVRLAGQHPEVADEDGPDRLIGGPVAFLDGQVQHVRAAGRNIQKPTVEEPRPIAERIDELVGSERASLRHRASPPPTTLASLTDSSKAIGIVARPLTSR